MDWVGEPVVSRGVVQRRFDLKREGRNVPGLQWIPEKARRPRPLVLLGHGGTLHKGSPYIVSLARRLVRHHGFAAAAIDGPVHGDRRPDGGANMDRVREEFRLNWAREGVTDEMVADWKATLDALQAQDEVGSESVGYWGLSMGTIYGLPFVAAEPRIRVAVVGLMGIMGPTADRLAGDAARIRLPVLFLQQWNDELIPRDRALALFDAIASTDKRMHTHPGKHIEVPREGMDASETFLAAHLVP
jgi:dienelactone hydrolase